MLVELCVEACGIVSVSFVELYKRLLDNLEAV